MNKKKERVVVDCKRTLKRGNKMIIIIITILIII